MLLHSGESSLLVVQLACRLMEMLKETTYYFTKGVVVMSLHSLETSWLLSLLLSCSHTQYYFHFCSVKVQS